MARGFIRGNGPLEDDITIFNTAQVAETQPVRYCKTRLVSQSFASGSTYIISQVYSQGEEWLSSDSQSITIPEDGLYSVACLLYSNFTIAVNTSFYVEQGSSFLCQSFQVVAGHFMNTSVTAPLSKGTILRIRIKPAATLSTISEDPKWGFTVALLSKNVPYLMANKGAIISSPDPGKVTITSDMTMTWNINPAYNWQPLPNQTVTLLQQNGWATPGTAFNSLAAYGTYHHDVSSLYISKYTGWPSSLASNDYVRMNFFMRESGELFCQMFCFRSPQFYFTACWNTPLGTASFLGWYKATLTSD